MIETNLTPIPQNYKNSVNWIIGAYEAANVLFAHGFQKDAIQNAVGARKTDKWKNWKCDISYKETSKGAYLIVEDSGTVGLIGRNLSSNDIYNMVAAGETLDSTERLARFSSMFNSGGNETGGGLFGVGKSVYSVASETYCYYYDSLREDNLYVANANLRGQVNELAFENDIAKKYIFENTGLPEKTTFGTRIIIESPKKELIDAINSGDLIKYIQETWWLTIKKFDNTCSISVNNVPVTVPDYKANLKKHYELSSPLNYSDGYRIKNFGVYVYDNDDNDWHGISYYRKGMKIGEVELKEVPDKIKNKFWGYIEVDRDWEDELSLIENTVHYGVTPRYRRRMCYRNLKNYCNETIDTLFIEWGYKKNKEHADKKLNELLNQITEDIQTLFDDLGFEDLGKGPKKPDFDVRWQNIKYPTSDTEEVTTNDEIKFTTRVKSSYMTTKTFEYKLYVINPTTKSIKHEIEKGKIRIEPNDLYTKDYTFKITKENSEQYEENRIVYEIKVLGSGKTKKKELPYFYDTIKPDNHRENVTLTLHDQCIFPNEDSRRVNFGESIKNVCYRIENKQNHLLQYRLNVSIHNASDKTCPKIVDVGFKEGTVNPYEEVLTNSFEEIVFEPSVYNQYLDSGVLELRARLIAAEDNDMYQKGELITNYHFKIFLNCDEKNGKFDSFNHASYNEPDNYKRSWSEPGVNRTIFLNIGHPAYLDKSDDEELQREYIYQEMLKQAVLLYLAEGKYDMFGISEDDFSKLDPYDAVNIILYKLDNIIYEKFKRGNN